MLDLAQLSTDRIGEVGGKAANLGELIRAGFNVPPDFCLTTEAVADAVRGAYARLEPGTGPVAVRSSATAEDLPGASFAGQQAGRLCLSAGKHPPRNESGSSQLTV